MNKVVKLKNITLIVILLCIAILFLGACKTNDKDRFFNTDESSMIPRLINVEKDSTFETIAKNIAPAVVAIASTNSLGTSIGSGVCVYSGGYILTNEHVVEDSNKIVLYLYNGDTANAIKLWSDTNMDIAILKSDVALPYLPINDDSYATGEDVMAVGTPLNLIFTHTYTKGIISAINRTLQIETENGISYMQNLIQHDASINPGNSGGPLINSSGEIVGINTLKVTSGEGLGFAIPSKSFVNVISQVVSDSEYKTPYFGVMGYDASIAVYYGTEFDTKGVYVVSVDPSSPAYLCGIRNGDIITKINDQELTNMLDLKCELYKYKANDKITVEFCRENEVLSGTCTLIERWQLNIILSLKLVLEFLFLKLYF